MYDTFQLVKDQLKNISPLYENAYQPPASLEKIATLAAFVNRPLPDEYYELYSLCNGVTLDCMGAFAYSFEFRSIEDTIEIMKENSQYYEQRNRENVYKLKYADKEINPNYEFNNTRIPIGTGTRAHLCVDLSPTESGTFGQVIFIDSTERYGFLVQPSLSLLLEEFKNDLASRKYSTDEEYPGQLIASKEIGIREWYSSERWDYIPKPHMANF